MEAVEGEESGPYICAYIYNDNAHPDSYRDHARPPVAVPKVGYYSRALLVLNLQERSHTGGTPVGIP